MMYLGCNGDLTIDLNGQAVCDNWVVVTEQELLNQALSNHLLSSEDFNILSASILAIMLVAMGLRVVLKTLNIGVNSNEKN